MDLNNYTINPIKQLNHKQLDKVKNKFNQASLGTYFISSFHSDRTNYNGTIALR